MSNSLKPVSVRMSDSDRLVPGEVRTQEGEHTLNADRQTKELVVTNDGDRPIQVGSHFHFPDVNAGLSFDRNAAEGYRLGIPAGKSIRFEPGASRTVPLVKLAGKKIVRGLQIKKGADD